MPRLLFRTPLSDRYKDVGNNSAQAAAVLCAVHRRCHRRCHRAAVLVSARCGQDAHAAPGQSDLPGQERYNGMVDAFAIDHQVRRVSSRPPLHIFQTLVLIVAWGMLVLGRLYRGLVPPLMLEAPKRAVKFAANDFWGKTYKSLTGQERDDAVAFGADGMLGGCHRVDCRRSLRAGQDQAAGTRRKRTSTPDPWMWFARSSKPMACSDCTLVWNRRSGDTFCGNGGYFSVIHALRAQMPKPQSKAEQLRNDFFCGAIGGTVGTVLNTPADVVKSRIQNTPNVKGVPRKVTTGPSPSMAMLAKERVSWCALQGFYPQGAQTGRPVVVSCCSRTRFEQLFLLWRETEIAVGRPGARRKGIAIDWR
ncbi:hypothetical protein L1887_48824 [Cichorium endivia]|nr:hypothetical protein L1887_48824 [Cichorium endivia]